MSDEPFAPERGPSRLRAPLLVGGLAFLGGVAVTAGALQWAGHGPLSPATPTPKVATVPQPQPSAAPALPPASDVATLDAREAALAGRLDQLELRLRDTDGSARAASSYATRAERLMIAFSVRRAVERGTPLGALEGQLHQRFGEDHAEAVAAILRAAQQPVTLEDLRLALDRIGPRLLVGADDSMWARARRLLGDLLVLRQADSPSPRPADRLRRARRVLDEGQVEAALAEVAHMPGVDSAESWVSAARRYIDAQRALREIEQAAMEVPAAAPPPVAAPAAVSAPATRPTNG
jgi:hypothetical protein